MNKLVMGLVIISLSAVFSVACQMEKKQDVEMGEAVQEEPAAAPAEPAEQQQQPAQAVEVEEVEEVQAEAAE